MQVMQMFYWGFAFRAWGGFSKSWIPLGGSPNSVWRVEKVSDFPVD